MAKQLQLKDLNARRGCVDATDAIHHPIILAAQDQLHILWSGGFDVVDSIVVLRTEGERLIALSEAISKNLV